MNFFERVAMRREILDHYLATHTDANGDWDGSPWPEGESNGDGTYTCPVCRWDAMPDSKAAHDCHGS
jgi:hypothetical protein